MLGGSNLFRSFNESHYCLVVAVSVLFSDHYLLISWPFCHRNLVPLISLLKTGSIPTNINIFEFMQADVRGRFQ